MINTRIKQLRELMNERNIKAYYIPTSDFHESEYVGEYFKARTYMSGFDGSAGVMLVTPDASFLWTDGRYFLQAEAQLKDSEVQLMKQGEPGVPTLVEYLATILNVGDNMGFDGRVVNTLLAKEIKESLNVNIVCEEDLVGMVWTDRPALPKDEAWFLEEKYSGRSIKDKLEFVRKHMVVRNADAQLLSTLDDISWLYNMRGNDVTSCPVVLSYTVIEKDAAHLFVDQEKITGKLAKELEANNVTLHDYDSVYAYLNELHNKTILMDFKVANYKLFTNINDDMRILNETRVTQLEKAIKNEVEVDGTVDAHIKDGVAVTKFIFWLKDAVKTETITEVSAAEKLLDFRKENKNFIEDSFATIAGYGPNGAIIHYHANPETCATLQAKGLILVDSGGHYLEGTTDITRTISLGELSEDEKYHYTLVLKSHVALAKTQFLHGARGSVLDGIARKPIWESGLDFKHGTGHGVGHVLNVHEGPNSIRYNAIAGNDTILEHGMIQSNEPGLYIAGSHGIRIENLMVAKRALENEYGTFMYFQQLTVAPYDRDAIIVDMLSDDEREWINSYHASVHDILRPYLNKEDQEKLIEATKTL